MLDIGANVIIVGLDQWSSFQQRTNATVRMCHQLSEISGVGGAKASVNGVARGRMPVFEDDFVEIDFPGTQESNYMIIGLSTLDSLGWRINSHTQRVVTTDRRLLPLTRTKESVYL